LGAQVKQLIILSLFALPNFCFASMLCRQTLLSSPTHSQIEATLVSLAKMKLQLDLARATGQDLPSRSLAGKYESKITEVIRTVNISESELREILKIKIAELQGLKVEEEIKLNKVKKEQDKILTPYLPSHSFKVPDLANVYFLGDGQTILSRGYDNYTTNPHELEIFDIATGTTRKSIKARDAIPLKTSALILSEDNIWYSLNAENLELKELQIPRPHHEGILTHRSAVSPSSTSVLIYENDFSRYSVTNESENIVTSGMFPKELKDSYQNRTQFFMIDDENVIIDSIQMSTHDRIMYNFDTRTQKLKKLKTDARDSAPRISQVIPESRMILAHNESELILVSAEPKSFFQLKKPKETVRMFQRPDHHGAIRQVLAANKDFIIISLDTGTERIIKMLNTSDLTDFKSKEIVLSNNSSVGANFIPGTEMVSIYDHHVQHNPNTRLHHIKKLDFDIYTFKVYEEISNLQIERQVVSEDGKHLSNLMHVPGEGRRIDVWEKQ
jgi:hypothetical protein